MTKRHSGTEPATALSPYLSLRESVRPAIFAYNLLAKEQGQAAVLAAEISGILKATEDLLEAAGLFHMLSPGPLGDADPTGQRGDSPARLIKAYSDAGMQWARIVGSCLSLADALLAAALWEDAGRLASYVSAAGEPGAAADIKARIKTAQRNAEADAFRARSLDFLSHASGELSDIRNAISILREARAYPSVALEIEKEMHAPLLAWIAKYWVGVQKRSNPQFVQSVSDLVKQMEDWLLTQPNGWEVVFKQFEAMYNHWH
jgi:hypothetical protein